MRIGCLVDRVANLVELFVTSAESAAIFARNALVVTLDQRMTSRLVTDTIRMIMVLDELLAEAGALEIVLEASTVVIREVARTVDEREVLHLSTKRVRRRKNEKMIN